MPKHFNVPVYPLEGEAYWVNPDTAFEMFGQRYPSGAQKYEYKDDPLRPWRQELHQLPPSKDNNNFSPCSIPASQMKANAGEVKVAMCGDEDENRKRMKDANSQIKRARQKIYWYPREGRDREGYYRTVTIVPAIPS